MTHGLYRVTGRRRYRGHEPGTEFVAKLAIGAERRAVHRGDIVVLDRLIPDLRPGSYTLPANWNGGERERTT